jgi:hypothetical protein
MATDRLSRILEECRSEDYPMLSAELVERAAAIENRNQFSDARDAARQELRALVSLYVANASEVDEA